jgi:deoxyribodipyrimidine photo-lyase
MSRSIRKAVATEIHQDRLRLRRDLPPGPGPVVYAMARDQRVRDNWALAYAQQLALELRRGLVVACPLRLEYPELTHRHAAFMIAGLQQVANDLDRLNIRFAPVTDVTADGLAAFLREQSAGVLITDFSPLRPSRSWKKALAAQVTMLMIEVDAHNIVPTWIASDKQEYAAYTIRPKINRLLGRYLTDMPEIVRHPHRHDDSLPPTNWTTLVSSITTDHDVPPVERFAPGETGAEKIMNDFLRIRLSSYSDSRNDPNAGAQSDLSPYLHFGQISAQRVALEAERIDDHIPAQEALLEELIIRRELSDNFCFYNDRYDSFEAFSPWAQKTLNEHRSDPRPYLYSRDDFETASTHDPLWNAAQTEMVIGGKMHGYLRMYWAKKILEWSVSPEKALTTAVYLNDKYSLDGRDPNGYAGIAWSIGGVHDRAWFEREIFGKVRFMSDGGCRRKFDVPRYIARFIPSAAGATK